MHTYDGFAISALFGGAVQVAHSGRDGARCSVDQRHGSARLKSEREHESKLQIELAARAMLSVSSEYFLSNLDELHARLFVRRALRQS